MSFSLSKRNEAQPPLDPPATESERLWWKRELIPIRRRIIARWSIPFFIVQTVSTVMARPEKWQSPRVLTFLPILCGLSLLAGWTMWLTMADPERIKAIRWKRIRKALSPDPAHQIETAQSGSRST